MVELMLPKSGINWPMIRSIYEATAWREVSTRQIARDHNITETAIRKRAKAEKWLRRDQRDNLLYGGQSDSRFKKVDWPRHRVGWSERAGSFDPAAHGERVMAESAPMPLTEREIERARARIVRRALPPVKLRENRKVTSEELVDGLSSVAVSLLDLIENALDRRDTLIELIAEGEQRAGGKMVARYVALQKEVDLKKLSAAALSTMMVIKFVLDQRSK